MVFFFLYTQIYLLILKYWWGGEKGPWGSIKFSRLVKLQRREWLIIFMLWTVSLCIQMSLGIHNNFHLLLYLFFISSFQIGVNTHQSIPVKFDWQMHTILMYNILDFSLLKKIFGWNNIWTKEEDHCKSTKENKFLRFMFA